MRDKAVSLETVLKTVHDYWMGETDRMPGDGNLDDIFRHNRDLCEALKALPGVPFSWLHENDPFGNSEQLSKMENADPIDRAAAIDALADYIHNVRKAYGGKELTAEGCEEAARSVLEDLPPANVDLSGYSDRLWKAAHERGKAEGRAESAQNVPNGGFIDRKAAIEALRILGDKMDESGRVVMEQAMHVIDCMEGEKHEDSKC